MNDLIGVNLVSKNINKGGFYCHIGKKPREPRIYPDTQISHCFKARGEIRNGKAFSSCAILLQDLQRIKSEWVSDEICEYCVRKITLVIINHK